MVSTSANISGIPAPQSFDEIDERILAGVDYVVNWRQSEHTKAQASSIIRLRMNGEVEVIRK
jgi:L-threonylcarbamoyladenylate synthase